MLAASLASVLLALTLVALKTWAWRTTESVALLSSLADSVLDLLASAVTFFAVRVALSPADPEHRFGHGKSEGVSSLVQAIIVTGSAAYVGAQAVERLLSPGQINRPAVGLLVMSISIVLTLSLVAFQRFVAKRTGSLAISADSMHYSADLATNLAVLAAIYISVAWDLYWIDPLLALVLVAVILMSVRSIVIRALDMLLDRELPDGDRELIHEIVAAHPEVKGLHDLRTRSSGRDRFIQLHLDLDPRLVLTQVHDICVAVERDLHRVFPDADVLIHADPLGVAEERDPF